MRHPKFEQRMKERLVERSTDQSLKPGYGIVVNFNKYHNTADIMMAAPESSLMGELHNNVPCPTQVGLQTAAPEPGRPCWVVFRGSTKNPIITHFFNHVHEKVDYNSQYRVKSNIPRFILSL